MMSSLSPEQALKHYFGYDAFRPGQRDVIEAALQSRDLLVLMPTGGGKSLCYQLPALLTPGVTLVISPLIALMQDQVLSLQNNGIPATYLNSSLTTTEQRSREKALVYGAYKLLYIAPERLLQADYWPFIDHLHQQQGIPRLVVDEAHCISEWGHDFRPEYRQLRLVTERLDQIPVTALTATATERVRHDILQQLQLTDPFKYTASFNRPNLYYAVRTKTKKTDQALVELLRTRTSGSAIIYCQSRASVDRLARFLNEQGIPTLPYHAGLTSEERQDHQTQFSRDQVQVMVATVAFGMGINKPDVRLVIHYDIPKTLENYYQESGRAGRDGLPASCILFFNAGDRGKVEFLIAQKTDPQEQRIARQQLRQMMDYANSHVCRRQLLLSYFSETVTQSNCQNCDNCLYPVAVEDRTVEAQKFLSCVYRCNQRFGMRHVIDVLRGSSNQKVLDLGHDKLSTYGIGKDLSQRAWQNIGRSLLQQDLLAESHDGFPVLSFTAKSWQVLKGELTVQVPKLEAPLDELNTLKSTKDTTLTSEQQDLFQHLRQLRKRLADLQSVPPFMIFPDRTLTEMAQQQPQTLENFAQLNGVGSKKLSQYGQTFLDAIKVFQLTPTTVEDPDPPVEVQGPDLPVDSHDPALSTVQVSGKDPEVPPLQSPSQDPDVQRSNPSLFSPQNQPGHSCLETLALHQQGYDVEGIARHRRIAPAMVWEQLATLLAYGADVDLDQLVDPKRQRQIFRAIYDLRDYSSLTQIREILGHEYRYEEIRLVRAALFYVP